MSSSRRYYAGTSPASGKLAATVCSDANLTPILCGIQLIFTYRMQYETWADVGLQIIFSVSFWAYTFYRNC
jgi:hypothetical protein